jgi:23S rRNA (cytosine1962-C5)-methyltransferase
MRAAVVNRRAADRLRAGHPWVYASDVVEVTGEGLPNDSGLIPVTGLIPITDQRGIPLGTALYSPSSQIALRLVSREVLASEQEWLALIESRLRRALALRATMQTEACRLVFSEADELPGLIIDRYASLLLVQVLARGLDRPEVRALVTRVLVEELAPETIVERGDARIAALEGLQTPALATLYAKEPQTTNDLPAERPALRLRRCLRAEDWRVSGPAAQLRGSSGARTRRGAGHLHLSGWFRAPYGAAVLACDRRGCIPQRA